MRSRSETMEGPSMARADRLLGERREGGSGYGKRVSAVGGVV